MTDRRDGKGDRGLSASEAELWYRAMRDVRKLGRDGRRSGKPQPVESAAPALSSESSPDTAAGRDKPIRPPPSQPKPPVATIALPPRRNEAPPILEPGNAPGLDKRTLARLKRGLIPPEADIDLHRLTQAEAHRGLDHFLAISQAAGRRCVLIVTGKGYGSNTSSSIGPGTVGVLRAMAPRWLNEPPNRERVLAFCHAPASQGGEGALYVLLRRRRDRN